LEINRCVASGSRRERVIRSLEITHQMKYFDEKTIFTAQQVERGKPAPDLFLFAAKQMGVSPQDCLVIEDSCAGIEAAQQAGMSVIGFLGGEHAKFEWYQEPIKVFGIPIAHTADELWALLKDEIQLAA
jgi:beta-phosphoglucomutase-like phosphatase (HAD superfamily)